MHCHEFFRWKSVFDKKESEQLPNHRPWDCKIKLLPGLKKKITTAYEIPPALIPVFDKGLEENLWKGYIQPSVKS